LQRAVFYSQVGRRTENSTALIHILGKLGNSGKLRTSKYIPFIIYQKDFYRYNALSLIVLLYDIAPQRLRFRAPDIYRDGDLLDLPVDGICNKSEP
jgi:hypothetical protein